ncbi:MAG TPA: glutaredoxin 3 [Steroidobacteraceae bacterium]|jgi:glutaredoxin 3|nr:glutaredoxin 3 [Steroidobacteraceae bacterium]
MAAPKVQFYATDWCPYCSRARQLLAAKGVEIEEIDVESRPGAREEMFARSGRRTVPQIFINQTHVGGCDDLIALNDAGGLDPLLQEKNP